MISHRRAFSILASTAALLLACSSSSSSPAAAADGGSDSGSSGGGTPPTPGDAGGDAPSSCPTQYEPLADALARWGVAVGAGTVVSVSWVMNEAANPDCTQPGSALVIQKSPFPPTKRSDDGNPCAPPHEYVQISTLSMQSCTQLASNACVQPLSQGGYAFFVDALPLPLPAPMDGVIDAIPQDLCTQNGCMRASGVGDVAINADGTLTMGSVGGIHYKRPSVAIPANPCP